MKKTLSIHCSCLIITSQPNIDKHASSVLSVCSCNLTFCVFETEVASPWTEETVRQCLFLYLSLLPLNHRLVHELASVYTEAIADIKRSVLRAIEQPVSHRSLWFPVFWRMLLFLFVGR